MDGDEARGGLGYLSTRSPTVLRLSLQMTDRHADAIAEVLAAEPGGPTRATAKIHAIALAWVIQTITDLAGHATAAGRNPTEIAIEIRPAVLEIIQELEAWPALQRRVARSPRSSTAARLA